MFGYFVSVLSATPLELRTDPGVMAVLRPWNAPAFAHALPDAFLLFAHAATLILLTTAPRRTVATAGKGLAPTRFFPSPRPFSNVTPIVKPAV